MYVIRFKRDSKVRYATETQGNPEYNAIDSAPIEGAKTWKTKREADNYLQRKVLVGRLGERIQRRWDAIEVVEITLQTPPLSIQYLQSTNIKTTQHIKEMLLVEIEELQQSLQIISNSLKTGERVGVGLVDTTKLNNLFAGLDRQM